jgi:AbrB family looped-hinge helix DNA binding protein
MSDSTYFDTKVTPEGRVLIPAAIRRHLGVAAGDRVRFELTDGNVRLVSARSLAEQVWAANATPEPGASVADGIDVRWARDVDVAVSAAKDARIQASLAEDRRNEHDIASDLLTSLDLSAR